MLDEVLRPIKEVCFKFIALYFTTVDPNIITLTSGIAGLICSYLAYFQLYGWALVFWVLNRVLDGLDGVVARVHNKQTDFGGYFDLFIDFIVYWYAFFI